MKTTSLVTLLFAAAIPGMAWADAKADLKAAVQKLSEAESYSWTSKSEMGGQNQRRGGGATEGKSLKNGISMISMQRGDNTTEAFLKDGKAVMKVDGAWKTPEELAAAADGDGDGQRGGRGRWMGAMLRNTKSPAQQASEIAGKLENVEEKDGALTGTLSGDAVKDLVSFGGRRQGGNNAPEPRDPSGTVKFWLKDGQLAKMETHVKATMSWNGEDRPIERTTTTEITNIGTSSLEVPEEVAKKLGAETKAADAPAAEKKAGE